MTKKGKKKLITEDIDKNSKEFPKEKVIYNRSNIEKENIKLEMNINLHDTRLLSKYLENELIMGLSNIITSLHNKASSSNNSIDDYTDSIDFYTNIYNIFNELAEITYRGMVEKEKDIIDSLKQDGIPEDGVLEILSSELNDYQRISNIFKAVDDLDLEESEAKNLESTLPLITKAILNKLESDVTSLYMPLVIKFVSFLSGSTRNYNEFFNESIFSESALEELLDLDPDALDVFLSKLSKVRVTVGEVESYLVESFTIYNNTTIIVKYPIFITNPIEYQRFFSTLDIKTLSVGFQN